MANVTYYIGAGASAGKRSQSGSILEGLPCVNEITNRLGGLIMRLQRAKYHEGDFDWTNSYLGFRSLADWENAKQRLIASLQVLYDACNRNATIDTYAKKLVLQEKRAELEQLERLLTLFFILEQVLNKPDSRYDTFLANILQNRRQFPENIKVLSWNYDSQFEIAYDEYDRDYRLNIGSKLSKEYQPFDILKINGSATFVGGMSIPKYRRGLLEDIHKKHPNINEGSIDPIEKILPTIVMLYQMYVGEVNPMRENKTNLSFAFDYTRPTDVLYRRANEIIGATNALVVIGYTFPFFNREIDRKLLEFLNSDATIYIQDINPERIKQSFKAVCPKIKDFQIVLLNEVDQFFLPPEL